ncbi:NUDIX domain-containing protein [Sporosarcina sp. ACRSL]|uniref:NUDIX domain-containing protein n=1 Tax=Sporosarcina sp. ACRSL TaxID=2918215 RepID=UPI001EF60995|nr:NUDIX domain-containing protein [Sporosarcina sp. ACRSL]MCG7342664.1 NUDIX domain-containing protein [Sporosarcina sp. ACRSL]
MDKKFHHLARGIFIKDGKILVARAIGHRNTFLPGGHIEFGESAKDALIREIHEELGISCTVNKFLGLVEHKWMNKGVLNCEVNQVFEVHSEDLHTDINPTSREPHIEFFWVNAMDLKEWNLQPHPLQIEIKSYMYGTQETWWASSLHEEIDEFNINK